MRLTHFAAAAAAAFFLAAGPANAATTVNAGYAGAQYAHIFLDTNPGSEDANAWGLQGAFSVPLSETFGLQVDASWNNVDPDHGDNDNIFSGTAHVFHRTDQNLIGGMAGLIHEDNADTTTWGVGAEDDYYASEATTLGGRIEYLRNDDADVNFVGFDLHARHFMNDNFRLEGDAGYGHASFDSADFDANLWTIGGEAEYQFAAAPISVFGGVHYVHADSDIDVNATVLSIGVRWNSQSLKERDRRGPSLRGLDGDFGGLGGLAAVGFSPSSPPPPPVIPEG